MLIDIVKCYKLINVIGKGELKLNNWLNIVIYPYETLSTHRQTHRQTNTQTWI